MKRKSLKKRIQTEEITFGSVVSIPHPSVVEILSLAGFDWVLIDTEHIAIHIETVQSLVQTAQGCGGHPIVRVPWNDTVQIKRVLDTGATSLMVPMVNTKQEAADAMAATKYPPAGVRGVGLTRAHDYCDQSGQKLREIDAETLVILQAEHVNGVKNLEEIVSVPGIDVVFVGPADLSASMGFLGQPDREEVQKQIDVILHICLEAGVTPGVPVQDAEEANHRIGQGFRFIQFVPDSVFLINACRNALTDARKIVGRA